MKESWVVCVSGYFDAGHRLVGYPGKCANLHGHRWRVEVGIRVTELGELGMGVDFCKIKTELKELLDRLDHKLLLSVHDKLIGRIVETSVFVVEGNPTVEVLARYIYRMLRKKFSGLEFVKVYESDSAWVEYFGGDEVEEKSDESKGYKVDWLIEVFRNGISSQEFKELHKRVYGKEMPAWRFGTMLRRRGYKLVRRGGKYWLQRIS